MERLQKVMAAAGIGSRRKCEELIAQGRVRVNGRTVTVMGFKVGPADAVEVDGKPVARQQQVYYLLNKPAGYVTTVADTHGRPTVTSLVPARPRVFPVGRLDMDTEGLLLLTNDGDLAHCLLHPAGEVKKIYRALVQGRPAGQALKELARGVVLADGPTAPARVRLVKGGERSEVELIIHEGRKRQVRRMLAAVGHPVLYLERTGFAFLTLKGVARGKYRHLTGAEVAALKKFAGKRGNLAGK